MAWAEWAIVGAAVIGAVVLLLLGLRLWRQVEAFLTVARRASATLAEATATLESAQSDGSSRFGGESWRAGYTRSNPTRRVH